MITISEPTLNLIEDVLIASLGPHYAGFSISPDRARDHDGDPALFIVARFDPPDALPSSRDRIAASLALRDRLLEKGDERLPYLQYDYPPDPVSDEAA